MIRTMYMAKKVLIFIDWYLPGYRSGGPVTSISNMIAGLHDELDFYILTTNKDYQQTEPYELPENRWVEREDCKVKYCNDESLVAGAVKSTLEEVDPDFVFINGIYSKYFSRDAIKYAKKLGVSKIIVSPRGMLSAGSLSVKGFKKKQYLRLVKATGMFNDVWFHATGDMERLDIRKQFPDARVHVAPNLPATLPEAKPTYNRADGPLRLITVARVAREKNTLLAIQALAKADIEVELDWYGPTYDQPYLESCIEAAEANKKLHVRFPGALSPEEIPSRMSEAHVFYLPTTGENFGHSILEALMHGIPICISNKTPWSGVNEQHAGWALEPEIEVLSNQLRMVASLSKTELNEISENAYNFARDYLASNNAIEANKVMFDA